MHWEQISEVTRAPGVLLEIVYGSFLPEAKGRMKRQPSIREVTEDRTGKNQGAHNKPLGGHGGEHGEHHEGST